MKGLDKIGYPYVINRHLNATKRLWIQDDLDALRHMRKSRAFKVVGPNLVVMPKDLPKDVDFRDTLYLHPCDWVLDLWHRAGFKACPLASWPVGIDTEEFAQSARRQCVERVLVYHKQRKPEELMQIIERLHSLRIKCDLIIYPLYKEAEYKEALSRASCVIWHGCHESQGIALQEALACDVPAIVCDVTSLSQARSDYPFGPEVFSIPVTAAPYFDGICGIKITDLDALEAAIEEMQGRLDSFHPRQFILDHLSLEGMARAFIGMWERWGLDYDAGLIEKNTSKRPFRLPVAERISRIGKRLLN